MPAKFIATRVYLKPLLPDGFKIDPDVALKKSKRELVRRIRSELQDTAFSRRAKVAFQKAIKVEVKASSLVVTAEHPAWRPLVDGQRKGQMKWLMKATRPIPIITDEGKLIFRNATARSMADGRWVHPGRQPSGFVAKAKQEAREFLKEKFVKEVQKQVRASISR